jgi:alpha-L-fucosidase 2
MIDGLIKHNLLPNLLATHPPLQLDGNFGMVAGICEMLLQSHAGALHVLPGVDRSIWPSGAFRGLRARGGFEVAAEWKTGSIHTELLSQRGNDLELCGPGRVARVESLDTSPVVSEVTAQGCRFGTRRGGRYLVEFD